MGFSLPATTAIHEKLGLASSRLFANRESSFPEDLGTRADQSVIEFDNYLPIYQSTINKIDGVEINVYETAFSYEVGSCFYPDLSG